MHQTLQDFDASEFATLPGEFLIPAAETPDPKNFLGKLREVVRQLRPVSSRLTADRPVFVSNDLNSCSHVFLRRDCVKKSFQAFFDGPYRVIRRIDKNLSLQVNEQTVIVNIDKVKPAILCTKNEPLSNPKLTVPENHLRLGK